MFIDFKLIGKRIKETRIQNNITQSALAEKIDVSVPYISCIENGKKNVSFKVFLQIVNELGVTADELLYGNQLHDHTEYEIDIHLLLSDCTIMEKRRLYDIMYNIKKWIRNE